ncbi:hypothetical protein N0V93_004545 [Gnomoniopsis smithogilvyi]|uniref:Major facilitator superfamily (MFS) profile domain-containing protein n=1 Tax=Gnomoniopsis smithogilvyi TaxID=1191159 RepID=A0A9W8YST0_9PEZI|nr:hypothetical protein N0V93_004545 [Gnomoniopsis smithogilvyi]
MSGHDLRITPTQEVRDAAPGTEFLYDTSNTHGELQHVRYGDGHVLLVPQPSLQDPNDPLRWPSWKKWLTFSNALGYSFLGGVTGPIMAGGMLELSATFNQPIQKLVYANGATLVCQGVFNIFWMPFAVKFGRRPIYVISAFLMGVACMWLGQASNNSYENLLVARAFLGAFEAPIESIVPSTVTDIFFLHDRGEKISLYGLSVLSGNELGPLFSALIIQRYGMGWAFWIVGFFIFLNSISILLVMPETKYTGTRPSITPHFDEPEKSVMAAHDEKDPGERVVSIESQIKKRTLVQELAFWSRPDPTVSLSKAFLRPFILLTYPTVVWASFVYGLSLGWNVILGSVVAQLFAPQYGFDSQAQGLVFISPFIGSLIGTWLCGPLSDKIATYYTKRNDGIREPEMRLPTCIIAAFLTMTGALVTSLTYAHNTHYMGPIVGYGILSAGAQMGATLSMSYSLDCHKELSVEVMVTVAAVKSLVAWIWTWVITEWLTSDGVVVVFMSIAAINVAVYLTTLPMSWYGKDVRKWIVSADIMGRAGLR